MSCSLVTWQYHDPFQFLSLFSLAVAPVFSLSKSLFLYSSPLSLFLGPFSLRRGPPVTISISFWSTNSFSSQERDPLLQSVSFPPEGPLSSERGGKGDSLLHYLSFSCPPSLSCLRSSVRSLSISKCLERYRVKGVASIRDVGYAHPGFAPYLARIRCPKVRCMHTSKWPF